MNLADLPNSSIQNVGQADGTRKLVSIVLTTYNGERFLPAQLDSLFNQTYSNIEIVAADDGSTDGTVDILHAYAARHPKMKVIVNEKNLGFVKNFDNACAQSSGEFIALCDQDDSWEPDKISKLVNTIGNSPMAYCDAFICDEELNRTGKKISDRVNPQPFNSCLEQAVFCRIYGNSILITRQLYNAAHPFLLDIPHDWWLSFIATLHGRIEYLDEPLVYYRQHSENLFGAVGGKKSVKRKQTLKQDSEKEKIRKRVKAFYNIIPNERIDEKKVIKQLNESYESFSLINNIKRVAVFLKYRNTFLKVKKHSAIHRFFFALKMFVKIK